MSLGASDCPTARKSLSHQITQSHNRPMPRSPADIEAAVADLKRQLENIADRSLQRIDCDPETIEQGLAKLVLGLIELLRQLLERQAVRRMEGGTLSETQIEEMGQALMKLEAKVHELAGHFGLKPEDLNLGLGPLGNLLDK
jgi:gas vesicle protein GvpK